MISQCRSQDRRCISSYRESYNLRMCFMLYAGTNEPIPRKAWNRDAPDICVRDLVGDEERIREHFTKSSIQNIGSTSSCGCDFPSAMFQNGGWPEIEYREIDEEQQESEQYNRKALVTLLTSLADEWVEIYGVWAGDYAPAPTNREEVSLADLLDPQFCFKERGFYRVHLKHPGGRGVEGPFMQSAETP